MNKIRFEDNYMFRNNRQIMKSPDVALTELIANAWDAGALNVDIKIPETEENLLISVTDDGTGMTKAEFEERWMTLNYNRTIHQGTDVVFPEEAGITSKRRAYGKNGVGRHGMLCFSDKYSVETWKEGKSYKCIIEITSGTEPFRIINEEESFREGHGTMIKTFVSRNMPEINRIKEIISARFIYDPQFKVRLNGEELNLATCDGVIKNKSITTVDGIKLDILMIDSTKSAQVSARNGIAFWVRGRLVGNPSWTYGKIQYLDARHKIAKRYTIIVQTNDEKIVEDVTSDWTGFYDTERMNAVYEALEQPVLEFISEVMSENVMELKKGLIKEKRRELEDISIADKRDISSFMDIMTSQNPMLTSDYLSKSVDALLQIQKSKRGTELFSLLGRMSKEEIDSLTDLLEKWDINDVVQVIDEIDKRIAVIEAIERIYESKKTDELHTLHPMVLNAKWLFGAEFDSAMFTSNRALNTLMKKLFKDDEYDLSAIANPRKRPDIVCLKTSTIRAVCSEKLDNEVGEILKPDQILIIEVKRGGYEIGFNEMNQADNYVRQIKKSVEVHKDATIHAFVVGASIGDISSHRKTDDGIIDAVTYGQLVQTAKAKLFGLKEKLEDHYNSIDDKSLVEKALTEPKQMNVIDYV